MSNVSTPVNLAIALAEECDRGKVREENQDSVLHATIRLGDLMIVADGIGGYQGGATASRLAVEICHRYLESLPAEYDPELAIREASQRANSGIGAEAHAQNARFDRMGSTLVLALIQRDADGGRATIGHVGDSRAYLARAGNLSRLTDDHSAVQALLNRNLITPEQALHHPDASVLTRSLGHKAEVEIDIGVFRLEAGDTLLLCSDGLWGYVPEQQIQIIAADPELTLANAAKTLLSLALEAGGPDNIGIEMARLTEPLSPASRLAAPRRRRTAIDIAAICLLAVAAAGALTYLAVEQQWLQKLGIVHRPSGGNPTHGGANGADFTFAVIGGSGNEESGAIDGTGWRQMYVPPEKQADCIKLAGDARRLTVFYIESDASKRLILENPSIFHSGTSFDAKPMDSAIQAKCGRVNFLVVIPKGQ